MKKIIIIIATQLLVLSLTGFKSSDDGDFGPWKTSSCHKGLDFCVKRMKYNQYAQKYEWYVKFRNRYEDTINFSYTAKESSVSQAKTGFRTHLESGEEEDYSFLIADANLINVFVDKVRFGEDDYTAKYAPCDNY